MTPGAWLEGAFEGDVEALPVGAHEAGRPAPYALRLVSGRLTDVHVANGETLHEGPVFKQERLDPVLVRLPGSTDEAFRCGLRDVVLTGFEAFDEGVRDHRRYRRVRGRLRGHLGHLEDVTHVRELPPVPPGPIERRVRPVEDPTLFKPARWRPLAAVGLSWELVGVIAIWAIPVMFVAAAAVAAALYAILHATVP